MKRCISLFASPSPSLKLLAADTNLFLLTATGPDKVAYPMLKHLPRSGIDLSWFLHSFPSIWKTSSIIPIHKIRKAFDSLASFWPITLTSCISKLFGRIILSRLLLFVESNSFSLPAKPVSALDGVPDPVFCSLAFSVHFGWVYQTEIELSHDSR